MNKRFENKISDVEMTSAFLNRVPFYIRLGVIPMRDVAYSLQREMVVDRQLSKINMDEGLNETELLAEICENQDRLLQEQTTEIGELQNQLADYEQELYKLDLQMNQLRKAHNSAATSENSSGNSYREQLA
ncbi:MAG: hypothetical protein ACRD47_03650 [Nitrososphaeraceae archaeon]